MLTNLEVFTPGITTPPIPIVAQDVSLDAIQIKNIDGLGPVKANISSTAYGSIDGESLDGTQTPKRNIVLTVVLNPNWASLTIESIRQILYNYFMPENTVRLRFSSTHMPTVEIAGVVESCEPNFFAKDPEYQISIICVDPYFVSIDQTVLTGVTSTIASPTDIPITFQGSIETGFVLDISSATTQIGEFRVVNKSGSISQTWAVAGMAINSTQSIRISSVDRNKFFAAFPVPAGTPYTYYTKAIAPGSNWVKIKRGSNTLQILSPTAGAAWSLSYYARFGGL
jgi:hypothetical protein